MKWSENGIETFADENPEVLVSSSTGPVVVSEPSSNSELTDKSSELPNIQVC